jgi:hypothetical protein
MASAASNLGMSNGDARTNICNDFQTDTWV